MRYYEDDEYPAAALLIAHFPGATHSSYLKTAMLEEFVTATQLTWRNCRYCPMEENGIEVVILAGWSRAA